jgi:hypothetical protein
MKDRSLGPVTKSETPLATTPISEMPDGTRV